MPATYDYKVRERGDNMVAGRVVGDSEGLLMTELREMA